jgi:2-iminobutanoate/2-iminopropanoate deaminase
MLCLSGVVTVQERRIVAGEPAGSFSQAVVAGGLIYVSAVSGTDAPGRGAEPNVGLETRRVLEKLGAALEASGSSLGQAVSLSVYLKSASDFDAMNAVYREFFQEQPPARTTVAAELAGGALVEMSAVAVPNGAPRETLLPAGWMKSPRPYSYIVRAGDLVFLSGLVSRRGTDDQVIAGTVTLQVKTILDNAVTLLRTAGLTLDDVVAARVFVTDDLYFEEMNNQYRRYFAVGPPARATAVTGLMGADAKVEITLVATSEDKRVIGPLVSPTLPVSTAIRAGRRLFLSGVVGNTDANNEDPAAQTRETLVRVGRTLEMAGASFADVVDSTLYVKDIWQASKINDVYREFFPKDPPARTMVGAKLISRPALIEMMMTAVK